MKTDSELADYWYGELIDSLRLISSDFSVQEKVLPDFVHVPDEVLNSFPIDSLHTIYNEGLITEEQLAQLRELDTLLDEVELPSDYEEMLEEMKSGQAFEELRKNAKKILVALGQKYEEPQINAVYVKGS